MRTLVRSRLARDVDLITFFEIVCIEAAIVGSSADAITAITPSGIFTDWNPATEIMYGFSVEEAVGCQSSIIVPEDLTDELQRFTEETGFFNGSWKRSTQGRSKT